MVEGLPFWWPLAAVMLCALLGVLAHQGGIRRWRGERRSPSPHRCQEQQASAEPAAGYAQEAERSLARGQSVARTLMAEVHEARFLRAEGAAHAADKRAEDALRCYERSLDLFRVMDHEVGQSGVEHEMGIFLQASGRWAEALDWLQASILDERWRGNVPGQAALCYELACWYLDQGALREAGVLFQQSMALFRRAGDGAGVERVGRTIMGLGVVVERYLAADRMTFRDIERGSAQLKKPEEEE